MKRKEGEVWTERGKTWVIEDGIKVSHSKLSKMGKLTQIPLTCGCPENKLLRGETNKRCWLIHGICVDCYSKNESQRKLNGTFEVEEIRARLKDSIPWINDYKSQFESFLQTDIGKKYITENGDIEDWSGGTRTQEFISKFEEFISQYESRMKKIEESIKSN